MIIIAAMTNTKFFMVLGDKIHTKNQQHSFLQELSFPALEECWACSKNTTTICKVGTWKKTYKISSYKWQINTHLSSLTPFSKSQKSFVGHLLS